MPDDEMIPLDAATGTEVEGFHSADYSAGHTAFYEQKNLRILPAVPPGDISDYAKYIKDKEYNEGWRDAQEEYKMRTTR